MGRSLVRTVLACIAIAGCRSEPPNVVLISMDTTRADRLGAYGNDPSPTPNLDRFAERATLYANAYSTSSWTLPAHASMFTGLLPNEHGVGRASDGPAHVLTDDFDTIAERLKAAGYRTGAVVSATPLTRQMGFHQGFDLFDDAIDGYGRLAEETTKRARVLVRAFKDGPYFLFVHYWDAHAPYQPPPPFDEGLPPRSAHETLLRWAMLRVWSGAPAVSRDALAPKNKAVIAGMLQSYDAELRYLDHHLAHLLRAIDEGPRGRDTLVIVTSDHGESFGGHWYFGHTSQLYEQFVRVPLIVREPGQTRAVRHDHPVQVQQIFATIARFARLDLEPSLDVRPLDRSPEHIVTQVDTNWAKDVPEHYDYGVRALYAPPYKLIRSTKGPTQLFDIAADPEELRDLGDERPDRRRALESQLDAALERHAPRYRADSSSPMKPEVEDSLRQLGYLE